MGDNVMVLVAYDVHTENPEGKKRLRRVARVCVNHGVRVQNSVFECDIEPAQFEFLKKELIEIIDNETDSLRFYLLGRNWKTRVEHHGIKPSYDPESLFVI